MEKIYPYLDIIFLIVILIFLILFFIRLIGKRRGLQRKEKFEIPTNIIGENKLLKTSANSKENNNNINLYAEGSLNYKIAKISQFDEAFEYRTFLNYCKEAFTSIVIGFNQGKLEEAKKYLSTEMFTSYQNYIDNNSINNSIIIDNFIIVDISNVSFIEKIVNISVKFVTKQTINDKTIENREVWIFTKDTNNKDSNWVVTKVIND